MAKYIIWAWECGCITDLFECHAIFNKCLKKFSPFGEGGGQKWQENVSNKDKTQDN